MKLAFEDLLPAIRVVRPEVESIGDLRSFRPTYQFFPAKLTITLGSGESVVEVLKASGQRETLQFEKDVLEALRELGLPVPHVRSTVFEITAKETVAWGLLLQEMEGSPLEWLGLNDLPTADTSCQLVLAGVERLHRLTDQVLRHRIASLLPSRSLAEEWESVRNGAGPWLSEGFFKAALNVLEEWIPQTAVPLVFSNGDYNPLNFLSKDAEIVGWLDFEHACFEDPQIGFAKFLLWSDDSWGWAAGARAGLVERYVFNNNIQPGDFYCRIVLRGLSSIHLRPVTEPPLHMIKVVKAYTEKLEKLPSARRRR